jgi:hypothetical protein
MRIRDAFVANHAETHDGLAFITGAFPEWWTIPIAPYVANMSMVVVLELTEADASESYQFWVHLVAPDGTSAATTNFGTSRGLEAGRPDGAPLFQVVTLPLAAYFPVPGRYEFVVALDELERLATVPLAVRLQGGATPQEQARLDALPKIPRPGTFPTAPRLPPP